MDSDLRFLFGWISMLIEIFPEQRPRTKTKNQKPKTKDSIHSEGIPHD